MIDETTACEGQGTTMRTLVVGAGSAGRAIARDLLGAPDFGLQPVGFLDDQRRVVDAELPHLGRIDELAEVATRVGATVVVIAIPSLSSPEIHRIAEQAATAGLVVRYLPSFLAALEREARVTDLHALQVDSLLGRQELHVVSAGARAVIEGRRVLVTGAGGSIGSELSRQISRFGPSALYMLDHDESNLHGLQLELNGEALLDDDSLVVADIRDRDRIANLFDRLKPEVVFHAAAHKHLPLLERHPCEGVKTNVLGTRNLLEAALDCGTERFILISTDKAANPTSILGATKRLAEILVRQAAVDGRMLCASVRFGNVLGSRGSLLHVLREQVLAGMPITVTHPDVTRYFMTVEEAVGLVLEAGRMADGGKTFVLDMGEPVRIIDLVHNFASQVHAADLQIKYTGLRPGEKLNETLFDDRETRVGTDHARITATSAGYSAETFAALIYRLYAGAWANRDEAVRQILAQLMPEYAASRVPAPRDADDGGARVVALPAGVPAMAVAAPYPDGF